MIEENTKEYLITIEEKNIIEIVAVIQKEDVENIQVALKNVDIEDNAVKRNEEEKDITKVIQVPQVNHEVNQNENPKKNIQKRTKIKEKNPARFQMKKWYFLK